MSDFTPSSPNYDKLVKTSFYKQGFMNFVGAELVDVQPGLCEIKLPYREELSQQHGFFHGGVVSTLADNASGYAAFSLMAEGDGVLTVEFKVNLMAPAVGEFLITRGEVIRAGKTLTVCQSNVFAVKGGIEKHCAVAQVTLMTIKDNPTVSG
ncbi:MAG: PaaI family thioesterase [Rhodospirillales bacterium]|nr:PaaI family thioesterase [Rhodospirillales bacterium]